MMFTQEQVERWALEIGRGAYDKANGYEGIKEALAAVLKEATTPTEGCPLAPGDVVQLASGGPAMTISHRANKDDADDTPDPWWCTWFDAPPPGAYQTPDRRCGIFAAIALRRMEPLAAPTSAQTSEPDAWQRLILWGGNEPAGSDDAPAGHAPLGPWEPRNMAYSPTDGMAILWRRPLRKVAP